MDRPTVRVLGFRTTYHKNAGQAELVARDWVKYAPAHDANNTQTEEMVNQLRPPENGLDRDDEGLKMGYMNALWSQIEPYYLAWKQGTEVPAEGIPLSAWAGVTSDEADVFRKSGIRTVEEVSKMTEGQMGKVMLPGIRSKKQLACEFLASRESTETASKLTALEEKNAALVAQIEQMNRSILEMKRKPVDDDDDHAPLKRGPGRPRKVEEAA